ncbi:MAG: response regulator transcription factor [Thermoanaerobaculia bacterium]
MAGRILIVEDDGELREAIRMLLEENGYVALTAATGAGALEALAGGERPCLILLDLAMPAMDGWAFLQHARRQPSMAGIPIVVLSGKLLGGNRDTALPADDYIRKPVSAEELLAQVARYCKAV